MAGGEGKGLVSKAVNMDENRRLKNPLPWRHGKKWWQSSHRFFHQSSKS